MILACAPRATGHRMRVVEPHQAIAIGRVHGQRIVQAMRLFRTFRHLMHDELHPVARIVDDQDLAVQVEKCVQRCVCRAVASDIITN